MDDLTRLKEEERDQSGSNETRSSDGTLTRTEAQEAGAQVLLEQLTRRERLINAARATGSTEIKDPGMVLVTALERPTADKDAQPVRKQIVEVLLFAATAPVSEGKLREIVQCNGEELSCAIATLNQEYEQTNRAFRIHRIAQGYQLYTLPEFSGWVKQLFKTQRTLRLSRASLETLAIVAYQQPVTKPEIEQYRGVDSFAPLATLLERKLITLAGRAHKPGNPFLYRTTREFLRYFGLAGLDDLPRHEELEEFLRLRQDATDADSEDTPAAEEPALEGAGVKQPD
jgi:segregation and condensation protein B